MVPSSPFNTKVRCNHQGFTLVELLAVIAIIGILLALLLPAVQAARDASRRVQCVNNLKQLGLGCIAYVNRSKTLPPGKECRYSPTKGTGKPCEDPGINNYTNWAIEILPFIEESRLYKQYRSDVVNTAAENDAVVATVLPTMLCPSDPNAGQTTVSTNHDARRHIDHNFAVGSYKGVSGRGYYDLGVTEAFWDSAKSPPDNIGQEDRGPLSVWMNTPKATCYMAGLARRPVKIQQIRDGVSHTLLIGEYTTVSQTKRAALWANSLFGLNLGSITLPLDCKGKPTCNTVATNPTLLPDYDKCVTTLGNPQPCRRSFAGLHGNGAIINFATCDGAVRQVSAAVDYALLAALATIDGSASHEQSNHLP
jgi:prepilin-type N-terminal cleavage/methylation domain-containing protein